MNELELWESMFGNSTNATAGSLVVNYKDFINRVEEYGNQRELEGRIEGATIAADAINREIGLELTTNGNYYIDRFNRGLAELSQQVKEGEL